MKKYKAAKGAQFDDKRAQIYGKHLEKIQRQYGFLQPALVLEDAKYEDSPLFEYFEWTNRKAANSWRLHQARMLMNHIITVKIIDGKPTEARAFYNVTIQQEEDEEPKRVYISFDRAFKHPNLAGQVVRKALAELIAWKTRYATYRKIREQFADVIGAIEKVKK